MMGLGWQWFGQMEERTSRPGRLLMRQHKTRGMLINTCTLKKKQPLTVKLSSPTTMTDEAEQSVLPITTPVRAFEYHEGSVIAVSVFPDRRRMVTGSTDGTLCLWNLKDGVLLKALEGHNAQVSAVAVSRDGRLIASGDNNGELIVWDGDTGEHLTTFGIYDDGDPGKKRRVTSLDFSPDGATLVIASEHSTGMWCTKTWQLQRPRFHDSGFANCVRYSPSGKLLAIANYGKVGIYRPRTRECIAPLNVSKALLKKPAWSPDSTRLLSLGNPNSMWSMPTGSSDDFSIREWDPSTWKQVGNPWEGHTKSINAIAINPAGTLAASASDDNHVRLWQLSDRRTIAIFQHSDPVYCVAFSTDGNHILSGGEDTKILEWRVPEDALLGDDTASPLFDVKVHSKVSFHL
jgi:WD40 repeat protein